LRLDQIRNNENHAQASTKPPDIFYQSETIPHYGGRGL